MIFKKIQLKKEASYLAIQQEIESYRNFGLTEYKFLCNDCACEICSSLNGKVFFISDAKLGINLPPMHHGCKCTIIANAKRDLFKNRDGANPLKNNSKFEEWKKKHEGSI